MRLAHQRGGTKSTMPAYDSFGLTPTEHRLYSVLADGLPHSKPELRKCLNDDMALPATLWVHISRLRTKVRPQGRDILIEYVKNSVHYRLVELINRSIRDDS